MVTTPRDPRALLLDEFQDRIGQGLAGSPEVQAVTDELLAQLDAADTRPVAAFDRAARWASELADVQHLLTVYTGIARDPDATATDHARAALEEAHRVGVDAGEHTTRTEVSDEALAAVFHRLDGLGNPTPSGAIARTMLAEHLGWT